MLPDINHSFLGKTPEQTRDPNLKALAATFQLINSTIGNASKNPVTRAQIQKGPQSDNNTLQPRLGYRR